MFNQEIVDMLEQKFGRKHAVIFCQMEAMKNELIAKDMKEKGMNPLILNMMPYGGKAKEMNYVKL
jgi:hypothetical protein